MSGGSPEAGVAIVGSGIAGAMMAWRLASAGVKVVVLEGGPEVTRADLHERFLERRVYSPTDVDPNPDYAPSTHRDDPDAYLINAGPIAYNIHMTKAVGGTTWHWTAAAERFADEEFRLRSTYGIGVDWPIRYEDLEASYSEAEHEMGVSAPSDDAEAARRKVPTPMADFVWPYAYTRLRERLAPHGYRVVTNGFARNTREYDGRPACRGNNTCWPICPIGAQYAAIVHVDKARRLGVEIRPESLVTRLETDATGRIASAVYRRPDGSRGSVTARIFVLAANGLETAKILLASASDAFPAGLANSSDQVGRNLMDYPSIISDMVIDDPIAMGRGPVAFGAIAGFDTAGDRRHRAKADIRLDNRNNIDLVAAELLRDGLRGDDLDRQLRFQAMRRLQLISEVEVMPDPERRITLDWRKRDSAGQPRMRVNFDIDEFTRRSMTFMTGVHADIAAKLGAHRHATRPDIYFANRPCGAARMGHDPRTSVVDPRCRAHDHDNLYLASSAVFPTLGGTAGPTLTIAALALRTAQSIIDRLRG